MSVGLFIASIEEGARIFTPVRLLPFDHPEALGHEFPTVLRFHGGEDALLETLGREAGLLLRATLQRYPREPDDTWPYEQFQRPPLEPFESVSADRRPARDAPLPGLRSVAFLDRFPVAFIVDTRELAGRAGNGARFGYRGSDRPGDGSLDPGVRAAVTLPDGRLHRDQSLELSCLRPTSRSLQAANG